MKTSVKSPFSMQYPKTPSHLKADLLEQIEFLNDSCLSYDQGKVAEAKRMAVALGILLHDRGRNTHSLLSQLGIKEKLSYHAFLPLTKDPEKTVMLFGLCMSFKDGALVGFEPNLGAPGNRFTFSEWWNDLQLKSMTASLTRSDIILSVSDTDGGAHVDPELRGHYANLAKNNGAGWLMNEGESIRIVNGQIDLSNFQPVAGKHELMNIRQFTHELLSTFDEQLAPLLSTIA